MTWPRDIVILFRCLSRNEQGSAFLVFALGLFLTLGGMAFAFDLTRFFSAKTRLSFAVEMAAVAAAQNLPFMEEDELLVLARDVAAANFGSAAFFSYATDAPPAISLGLLPNETGAEITVTGEALVPTTLLRALQFFDDVTVSSMVTARAEQPEIELALVIEASEALAADGRLQEVALAAADFVNALGTAYSSGDGARFAVVPVGNEFVNIAPHDDWVMDGVWPINIPPQIPGTTEWEGELAEDRWCVSPRAGSAGEDDTPPDLASFPLVLSLTSTPDPGTGLPHFENITTASCRADRILPLSDPVATVAALSGLSGNGVAAHGRAMIWAERSLSPGWREAWNVSPSHPVEYDDAAVSKAVLLIAGSNLADAAEEARFLTTCTRLREQGVVIYVIDYLAPAASSSALQQCGGAAAHYFRTETDLAMREAFFSLAKFLTIVRFPGA